MRSKSYPDMIFAAGRIGLISDTHGLVRPEALAALKTSELIIHAGDIGSPDVIAALEKIAPVLVIKGNNDRDGWAKKLPDLITTRVNGTALQIIHNLNEWTAKPSDRETRVVISGHSHKPAMITRDGVLFINPGSAGPRRFKLPVAVARLTIVGEKTQAKIVELRV